jgi:uncharacterized protein DUF3363
VSDRDASEIEELFRPRFGRPSAKDRARVPSLRGRLARGRRNRGSGNIGRQARTGPGRVAVKEPRADSRRCVIKARYVPMTAGGLRGAKLHLAYLERDRVDRDGSPGRLYGADANFSAETFQAPLDGEQRQFRFIVSPEDGDALDLKEFGRRFISQVENDLGRHLVWAAVNHYNTGKPHVHIVVRGVDRDGDDVRIDGRYIGREMRWRAQEIVTRELGPRLEFEFTRTRAVEIEAERFTEIDRMIAEHAGPDRTVTLKELTSAPAPEGRKCVARLKTLEQFDLAREVPSGTWQLADGWKESLVQLGEYHDRMERLIPLVGRNAIDYQVLDPTIPVPAFEGIVVGKGLHDELTGEMFAAVQTNAGRSYYIPLRPEVAESLRQGEMVRVGVETEPWLKPADRIIERFARENGGIYDPPRHQRALETLPRASREGDEPSPGQRVAANIRRLERLARYRLATQLPDGRWQVAPNLTSELETRERTHPRHLLRVEPVRAPALDPAQARVPGVENERAALGRQHAERLGLTFVSDPPRFRGRVLPCDPTPSGREFVRVVDEARRQFTLVPKPTGIERLRGRVVVVSRDRDQQLSIRLNPDIAR